MASTSPSTAPKRKWVPCSRRWRDKLQELANMEESQVRTVGGLIYVPNDEKFRIALIGTNEVLLGLRSDGTEVAIKKMIHANFKKLERELEVLLKYRFVSQYVVQYVDLAFDNDFGYIAMQLCDYNLEEYIERLQQPADPNHLREKVKEFLKGLKALHEEAKVIHRDIKPRNVLIDKDGRVRLADFEISHILDPDQTTKATERAGTKNWEATEIIKTKPSDQKSQYKRSTDIQVAGMLVFYILSGGKHLFGDDFMCIYNICSGTPVNLHDLKDVEAEDLVESMVNINPKERPRITEVLKHPYFWNDDRKEMFLGEVGNVSEVENYKEISDENLAKDVRGKSFCMWKTQLNHVTDDLDNMKKKWLNLVQKYAKDDVKFPESLLCLLRFIRNRQVHSKNEMDEIKVMQLFPDLVVTVYKYAKNRNWRIKGFLPLPPSGDRRVDPVPHQEMGTEVASRPEGTMAQTETGVADRLDPLSSTGVEKVAGKAEMDPVQQQKTDCPDNGEENIMDVHTDGSKGLIPMADTPVEVPLHYRGGSALAPLMDKSRLVQPLPSSGDRNVKNFTPNLEVGLESSRTEERIPLEGAGVTSMTGRSDHFPLNHNDKAAKKVEMNPIQEHKNDHPDNEEQRAVKDASTQEVECDALMITPPEASACSSSFQSSRNTNVASAHALSPEDDATKRATCHCCFLKGGIECKDNRMSQDGILSGILNKFKRGIPSLRKTKTDSSIPNQLERTQEQIQQQLSGVDLKQYMFEIVNHISWKDMAKVAYRSGMTDVQVERHQHNHPYNEEEQVRSLLNAWIEMHGLNSTCMTFLRTLRSCNLNKKANEIERLLLAKQTIEHSI